MLQKFEEDLLTITDKSKKFYLKLYIDLIKTRLVRGTNKKKHKEYYEIHHILPKCMGGEDGKDNYVLLTYKEHIVAHKLLTRIYPNISGLWLAVEIMYRESKIDSRLSSGYSPKPSLRELEEIRKHAAKTRSQAMIGTKLSEETKRKLSESHKGKKASEETKALLSKIRSGRIVKQETKEKVSKARMGMKFSEEHKRKLSERGKEKRLSQKAKDSISGSKNIHARSIINCDGKIFETVTECSKFYSVSTHILYGWIKKGKYGLKYNSPEFRPKRVSGPDGTIYSSAKECSRKVGRASSTIIRWCKKVPEMGYKYID